MNHRFLTYHDSSISYSQFGNGQTLLICLHGYGEDAASFAFLEPFIGSDFTCIALEMPFHGNTNWNESYPFTVTILTEIIELIWQGPVENAYVIGYSMGGRIALQLLEYIPACISKLILVAPDGLQKNIWYTLSTQNSVGNTLFHYTMRNPDWFFSTVSLLYKLGFINKSIYNFVHFYLDDAESRMLLYQRWTILRKFNPRISILQKMIQHHKIKLRMLYGKYDRIILSKRGYRLMKHLEENVQLLEIDAGHQLLKVKYKDVLLSLIYT